MDRRAGASANQRSATSRSRLETGQSWLLNIPAPNVPSPTFLEPRALAAGDVVALLGPLSVSAELVLEPFEIGRFFVVVTVADREIPPIDRVDVRLDVESSVVLDADFPNVVLRPEVREQPVRTYYPFSSSAIFADSFESGDTSAWASP